MKGLLFFLICCFGLHAGTVRLYNDSPYKLRAVIRGADGSYLGEMILLPEHFNTWSDEYPSFGPGGQIYQENPNRTITPYTVQWYCLDGGVYGISTNVPTGGAVIAEASEGPRICKPPQQKQGKSPYGPKEDDEQLYKPGTGPDQNKQSSSSGTSK